MSRVLLLFSVSCLLALLASCAGGTTGRTKPPKPLTQHGRVLTGITEYYRPGYTAPRINVAPQLEKPRGLAWFGGGNARRKPAPARGPGMSAAAPGRDDSPYEAKPGKLFSWIQKTAPASGGTFPPGASPVFANPDGTTSRVVGFYLVRSDGTRGDMIGNTIFHPNGTTSRIVGNTLIHPDGTKGQRIR